LSTSSGTLDDARVELYDIMSQDLAFERKAQQVLALGERYLGVDNAHLTRIDQETDYWEAILSTDDVDGDYPPGLALDLRSTYCRRAIADDGSLALHDAPEQGWDDDPAYEEHGLHCYHGTPITVDDDPYGTLCFVSRSPRDEPFTPEDTLFADLIAR
jgi:GAF domain-containing protein